MNEKENLRVLENKAKSALGIEEKKSMLYVSLDIAKDKQIRLENAQKEIRKLKEYIDYTKKIENGKRCLSLLGLIGSGMAILVHPVFIWGCIASLGGVLLLSILGDSE
ncbi:MAG: hypothetical protein ACTSRS_22220 [Candidatus Helarchaeota archaeon]